MCRRRRRCAEKTVSPITVFQLQFFLKWLTIKANFEVSTSIYTCSRQVAYTMDAAWIIEELPSWSGWASATDEQISIRRFLPAFILYIVLGESSWISFFETVVGAGLKLRSIALHYSWHSQSSTVSLVCRKFHCIFSANIQRPPAAF